MKQKELIEKVESLEKEINYLKEKKQNKIHYLFLQIMEKYTKNQIIVFSTVFLFLFTLFAYAGTVSKTNTFSDGEVVSASKINTNFDTLFTLVNGNLNDDNINSLSSSKITGVINTSILPKPTNPIVFFATDHTFKGDFGGRSGADQICRNNLDNNSVFMFHNSCSNVRALISVDANDEIRDMVANYGVPTDRELRGTNDVRFGTSWDNITSESFLIPMIKATPLQFGGTTAWGGTIAGGALGSKHCTNWTDASSSQEKANLIWPARHVVLSDTNRPFSASTDACTDLRPLICICF